MSRKTIIARLVLWLVGWVWIGRILILLGLVCFVLYYTHAKWGDWSARSEEAVLLRSKRRVVTGHVALCELLGHRHRRSSLKLFLYSQKSARRKLGAKVIVLNWLRPLLSDTAPCRKP